MLALAATFFLQRADTAPLAPAPLHYLDDQAGLLSPQFAAAKNQYLDYLSRVARIAQISIVLLPHAPSADIEAFTIRAATEWKIGAGGVDNGLALFVFRDERKLRLEVGYGLESVITDAVAHRLLTEVLAPAFAQRRYEAGIEDFLDVLDKTLEASEAASHRASHVAQMIPFVVGVLRNSPGFARKVWQAFVAADTQGRMVLSLFGLIFAGSLAFALIEIALGVPALILLPWRLLASPTLRTASWSSVREQFRLRNFVARPPPVLIGVFNDLQLGLIVNAAYMLVGIVVGIAFLFVGSDMFLGGLGRFGGAGATVSWAMP